MKLASEVDLVIAFTGTSCGEGADRENLAFPKIDTEFINNVAQVNQNVVVCVTNPGKNKWFLVPTKHRRHYKNY